MNLLKNIIEMNKPMIIEKMYLLAKEIVNDYEKSKAKVKKMHHNGPSIYYTLKSINYVKENYPNKNFLEITNPMSLNEFELLFLGRIGYRITIIKEWKENANVDYLIEWNK